MRNNPLSSIGRGGITPIQVESGQSLKGALSQKLGLNASLSATNLSKYYTKDEIDKLFAEVVTLKKASYFDFPNIGEESTLYVDVVAGSTYIWDTDTNTYVCIGKDYEKIQTINGGNANE